VYLKELFIFVFIIFIFCKLRVAVADSAFSAQVYHCKRCATSMPSETILLIVISPSQSVAVGVSRNQSGLDESSPVSSLYPTAESRLPY